MIISRKDFLRLSVVAVGSAALGATLAGCGSPSTGGDAGSGGGTGGGSGGGTGGGSGGGTGGGSGGGTGGGGTGGGTGGGSGGGTGSTCATSGAHDTSITANHGHSLLVPATDFSATGDKTYDIRGTASHAHSMTLTEAQRTSIKGGTAVVVTSTVVASHSHDVTVACA